jgi:hypothetical protein
VPTSTPTDTMHCINTIRSSATSVTTSVNGGLAALPASGPASPAEAAWKTAYWCRFGGASVSRETTPRIVPSSGPPLPTCSIASMAASILCRRSSMSEMASAGVRSPRSSAAWTSSAPLRPSPENAGFSSVDMSRALAAWGRRARRCSRRGVPNAAASATLRN